MEQNDCVSPGNELTEKALFVIETFVCASAIALLDDRGAGLPV